MLKKMKRCKLCNSAFEWYSSHCNQAREFFAVICISWDFNGTNPGSVEELEEAEEAIITRGSKITRVRRRRGNEWVSEQEGMSQRPGTDEVNNICNIGLDQNRNSLIRSQPVQNPAEKTSGDLDTIDT